MAVLAFSMNANAQQSSREEQSIEQFETQLDRAVKSVCHGYVIDSLPEFMSGVQNWLNENTPFCQTVRTLPDDQSAYELLKKEKPEVDYTKDPNYKVKYLFGYNEDLYRNSDCDDWMCEHIRNQVFKQGHPISLIDYKKVEQHCEERYECIESWFKSWPRALPQNNSTPSKTVVSLDDLLGNGPATATDGTTIPPSTHQSGLTLDDMLDQSPSSATSSDSTNQTISSDITLDNVYSGREKLAMNDALSKVNSYNRGLSSKCNCSLKNSGCYSLPSKALLNSASEIEQQRYGLCAQWQQLTAQQPGNAEQAETLSGQLAKLKDGVSRLDQKMNGMVSNWKKERQRLIAQQKQQQKERNDSGWLAGMAMIALQAGAATNGIISAEQAAQNAVTVAKSVQGGENWASAMTNTLSSTVPSYKGSPQNSGSQGSNTGGNSISCYNAGQSICIDYTVYDQNQFNQIKRQCQVGNNRIVSSCEVEASKRCTHSSSTARSVTYSYMSSPEDVKQSCLSSGGSYN